MSTPPQYPRTRQGNGHTWDQRTCDICQGAFKPKSPSHVHCTHRCGFVAIKLRHAAAKRMTREVAIKYYMRQYDDPLRMIPNGDSKVLMRHITNYCDINDTNVFMLQDIGECAGRHFSMNEMEKLVQKTDSLEKTGRHESPGGQYVEWVFRARLL